MQSTPSVTPAYATRDAVRFVSGVLLMLSLLMLAGPAAARVFACDTSSGTIYQDRPCERKTSSSANTADAPTRWDGPVSGAPESIDSSWFDSPGYDHVPVYCDRYGCQCGTDFRSFSTGLTRAVADALYLDGSWHRLDNQTIELEQVTIGTTAWTMQRLLIEQTACQIRMSQRTLELFGERVRQQLQQAAFRAADNGFTAMTECAPADEICERAVDVIGDWKRFSVDLNNLSLPRDEALMLSETLND